MSHRTLEVEFQGATCTVTLARPEAANAIVRELVDELSQVVAACEDPGRDPAVTLLVLRGQPEAFCTGADFSAMVEAGYGEAEGPPRGADPAPLYDLWCRMAAGPFVTVSLVRGRATAGGVGFVAAADIALADHSASFALSELLFGLHPACVLPFLVQRVGRQRAHYMTLMTRPVDAVEAERWGLVDAVGEDAEELLRRHLLRLRRLGREGIARYKRYALGLGDRPDVARPAALAANREMFASDEPQRAIRRYVEEGKFPWEP